MTAEKVYDYTTAATPATELLSQRTFTYDTVWKDQMLTCGGKALTYDGVGNLLSYDGVTFNWTRGRRLSGVTKADGTKVAYTYNHNGQRVSKTVGGVKHTYFYSGNLLMREKASGLDMRFSYNSVGNPVSILYNNVEYYYVKNLQGDIIGLINAAGTWVVEYSYDVWGNIRSVFGSMASTLGQDNPIRYRGYYYDAETKLYYVSSRYYSPELCRFINPDNGISGVGGDTRGCNLFSYCLNNPVNMSDPGGNWPKWISNIGNVVKWVVNTAVSQAKSAVLSNTTVVYNGLPRTGEPGSSRTLPNPDGTPKQKRWYGPDGNAERDRDYNHSGNVPFPHDHVWENGKRGKEHLPPSPEFEFSLKSIIGGIVVTACVVGMLFIAANDLTGVGVVDDFLFAPLSVGISKGLIMIFG